MEDLSGFDAIVVAALPWRLVATPERRGFGPRHALLQFMVAGLLSLGILIAILLGSSVAEGGELPYQHLGFLLLMMTPLTVLHDRYRPQCVACLRTEDASTV